MRTQNPWLGSLLIVVIGTALGLGYNTLHPRPLPWIAQPKTAVTLENLAASPAGDPAEQPNEAESVPGTPSTDTSSPGEAPPAGPAPSPAAPAAAREPDRGRLNPGPAEVPVAPGPGTTTPPGGEASPTIGADAYADIPGSEYPIEVSLAKAKEFYDRGGMIVLDAREPDEYAEGHIRGSLSAPADAMAGDLEWLERTAKETRPILVYCDGGECELSLNLGFELNRAGHRRVLVLKEGYPDWKDAGYPIAEGATP